MNRRAWKVLAFLVGSAAFARAADDSREPVNPPKTRQDLQTDLAVYTRAIAKRPEDPRPYLLRGAVRAKLGDDRGAIADETAALMLDPKSPVAFTNRANARAAQHDFRGAIADYGRALALDPRHARAFLNRGNVEAEQRNDLAAIADYDQALALEPGNVLAFYNRAGAERATENYGVAIDDYSRVLALQPSDVRALLNRAVLHLAQRQWSGAQADLNQCLALLPPDRQIYPRLYLWVGAVGRGDAPQASTELRDYLARVSAPYARTWAWTVAHFCASGQRGDGPALLVQAAQAQARENKGQVAQAYFYLGVRNLLDHDADAAAASFKRCVAQGDPKLHEVILAREEVNGAGGLSK